MIYLDKDNYPMSVDDGMDSCVRNSIMRMSGKMHGLSFYEKDGYVLRHPKQIPANNRWNSTKDQLKMFLIIGAMGVIEPVRRIFWKHFFRLGFCANFQRDYYGNWKQFFTNIFKKDFTQADGSWKYPWPHYAQDWNGDNSKKGPPEYRYFDFADFLLPNDWGAIILAGNIWLFYPLLPICYVCHFVAILVNSINDGNEQNQMIAECYTYKTLKFYNAITHNWRSRSKKYWSDRNEIEYHEMLLKVVDEACKK